MRIGLLTAFSGMVEHYSLTRIVLDQLSMIREAGHQAVLITLEDFPVEQCPAGVELRAIVPFFHKKDYQNAGELTKEHASVVKETSERLAGAVKDLDAVFTHDIIFTGWNLPINFAVQRVARSLDTFWLHWVHSVPGGSKRDYWRLPLNSLLVYPNHSDRLRCAEHFLTQSENVAVIPHSLDPCSFLMNNDDARELVRDHGVLSADLIQTFPVPTDRMEHKGLQTVIDIFAQLKAQGAKVKLIVCNSWCTTPELRKKVQDSVSYAEEQGLNEGEVVFTSQWRSRLEVGVPNEMVRDLMLISNLFVCPTKSETFGLTIAEAALCGQLLVLNANLPMLSEVAGAGNALYFTFGSHQQNVSAANWSSFYADVAKIILNRFSHDTSLRAKTHFRQSYNRSKVWSQIERLLQEHAIGARLTVNT